MTFELIDVALLGFGGISAYLIYTQYSYDKELERVDENIQRIADALNDLITKHNASSERLQDLADSILEELDRMEEEVGDAKRK